MNPSYTIKSNETDPSGYGIHNRNSAWTIAFIRYKEPASAYGGQSSLNEVLPTLVVENDCVSVSLSNAKSSFAKTATLTMKVTDLWYASNVNPGDWVFVWLNESQDQNNKLQAALNSNSYANKKLLNGWDSGLKFVGRVLGVSPGDTISSNGVRTQTQVVQCQAFLELATSIYYTYLAQSAVDISAATPSAAGNDLPVQNLKAASASIQAAVDSSPYFQDAANKFMSLWSKGTSSFTPDSIISMLFALTMGVDRGNIPANQFASEGLTGSFNDAISIPGPVDGIMGNLGRQKLCQLYQLFLGVQKYRNAQATNLAQRFTPVLPDGADPRAITLVSPYRTKGFCGYTPVNWDNRPIWSILTEYLNPTVNEMFTSLRIGPDGVIKPTLTVREKPFSTGLWNVLTTNKLSTGTITKVPAKTKSNKDADGNTKPNFDLKVDTGSEGFGQTDDKQKTYFGELPRWVIDESMLTGVNTSTSESNRINFVQIWGVSKSGSFVDVKADVAQGTQYQQMQQGNYFADNQDISRHGMRALIDNTQFDISPSLAASNAPEWARMVADWSFNGHLKLAGTITCIGIQAPIVEGDNVEVRGVVYHIDSVTHTASLASTGSKTWSTTLSVSNGILAASLNSPSSLPKYACHLPNRADNQAPGYSEVQAITTRKPDGEQN